MLSFICRAPLQIKAYYAFKIYDADKDGFIDTSDIVYKLKEFEQLSLAFQI